MRTHLVGVHVADEAADPGMAAEAIAELLEGEDTPRAKALGKGTNIWTQRHKCGCSKEGRLLELMQEADVIKGTNASEAPATDGRLLELIQGRHVLKQ